MQKRWQKYSVLLLGLYFWLQILYSLYTKKKVSLSLIGTLSEQTMHRFALHDFKLVT